MIELENKRTLSALDWSDFDVWSQVWTDAARNATKASRRNHGRRRSWSVGDAAAEEQPCAGCKVEKSLADRLGLVFPSLPRGLKPSQYFATSNQNKSQAPQQQQQHQQQQHTAAQAAYVQFAAGALGGSTATYSTHWLDTIKVKMQAFPQSYPTTTKCLTHTLHNEGVRGLYQGAIPAVVGHTTKASIVFMSYGLCEEAVRKLVGKTATSDLTVCQHATAGAATGVVASFVLCPLELIKCRMQAMQQIASKSTSVKPTGALAMARNVLHQDGVRGLYRGLNGMWVKEIPGSFIYFGSYEAAKCMMREIKNTKTLNTSEVFLCGIGAGLCFCITHRLSRSRLASRSCQRWTTQGLPEVHIPDSENRRHSSFVQWDQTVDAAACSYSGIQFVYTR